MLKTVRIFTIAAIRWAPRWLYISHIPWFRSQCAQTGRGVKSAGPDFHIIWLLNYAALRVPVFFEGKNQFLKIHNFLLAVMNEKFINTGLLKNAHPSPLRGRCLLRCKPHRSMNIYIRLAVHFFYASCI